MPMATTFQQRFREAFAALKRREPDLNQSRFADSLGMSRANVSHWINGRGKMPSGGLADAAAARLGVATTWLVKGEGSPDRAAPIERKAALDLMMEVDGMELSRDAILVARAFMELPGNKRAEFKRKIETAALEYATAKPDGELEHLAAPKKRHVKGTQ
jgi:transcriptional regulator with XRE-family HTH domain